MRRRQLPPPLVADYWIGSEKELTPCGPSNQICYNFICSSATKSPARLHLAVHPLALCAAFLRFFLRHRKKIANFGHVFNCGISACWLRALLVYPTRVTAVIQSTWTLSAPQRQQNENFKFQNFRVYKSPGTGCNVLEHKVKYVPKLCEMRIGCDWNYSGRWTRGREM